MLACLLKTNDILISMYLKIPSNSMYFKSTIFADRFGVTIVKTSMFKGLNITCLVYILALYFYNSGGLRVFNHFLRLISFLFCYFLIFLWIFSLVIFLNFFLNFLKKQALVSYKIFLIKKKSVTKRVYRELSVTRATLDD